MTYLSEPYPHWLIRMTRLGLPLTAEQLLSEALLDDRVSIWGREKDKSDTHIQFFYCHWERKDSTTFLDVTVCFPLSSPSA